MQNPPVTLSTRMTPARGAATTDTRATGNMSGKKFDKVLAREMAGNKANEQARPANTEPCATIRPPRQAQAAVADKQPETGAAMPSMSEAAPGPPQMPDPAALAALLPARGPAPDAGAPRPSKPESSLLPAWSDLPGRGKLSAPQAHDEPDKLENDIKDNPPAAAKPPPAAALDTSQGADFAAAIRQQAGRSPLPARSDSAGRGKPTAPQAHDEPDKPASVTNDNPLAAANAPPAAANAPPAAALDAGHGADLDAAIRQQAGRSPLPAWADSAGRGKLTALQARDEPDKLENDTNDNSPAAAKPPPGAALDAGHDADFAAVIRQQAAKDGTATTGIDGPPLPVPATPAAEAAHRDGEAPAVKALAVEPHFGASAWGQSLGDKTVWMVNQRVQVADLHLNPPDLGPLRVTVTFNNDQATASFVSQHAEVRQAIEAALPRLREMLAESGISLGNTSVDSGAARQQGSFADGPVTRGENLRGSTVGESKHAAAEQRIVTGRTGLVDTFA